MESFMKTISDQHDEIHQLKEKLWSQHVALDNQHALIHGLQLQISNMKSEQKLNLQNMKSEQELNLQNMKSEQELKIELQRVQLEHLQKQISEMKSKISKKYFAIQYQSLIFRYYTMKFIDYHIFVYKQSKVRKAQLAYLD